MTHQNLEPQDAKARLDEGGWTFLDVRTVEEFDEGHVPGSYNVPLLLQSPTGARVPNPEFLAVVKRHFGYESGLVLG
jgi:E3 ubiquitin-protein ligase RNF13